MYDNVYRTVTMLQLFTELEAIALFKLTRLPINHSVASLANSTGYTSGGPSNPFSIGFVYPNP